MKLPAMNSLLALPAPPRWRFRWFCFALSAFMIARGVILTALYPRIYKGLAHA